MLFADVIEEFTTYLETIERSPRTIRGYKLELELFYRYLESKYNCPTYLEDIQTRHIEGYLPMLKERKRYKASSRRRALGSIRSFYNFCVKKELTMKNMALPIEPINSQQTERTFVTEEEMLQIVEATDHKLVRLVIQTLYYTGLRISECLSLRTQDVDLKNRIIHVVKGKGNKDRRVPINEKLHGLLQEYSTTWRVDSPYFFASSRSGCLSPQRVNAVLGETMAKLGWSKKVTAHTFRHSFASSLVKKDVSLVKISKLLGHSSLKTTSVYTHSNIEDLAVAVNCL